MQWNLSIWKALKKLRKKGSLKQVVKYLSFGSQCVIYNKFLCANFGSETFVEETSLNQVFHFEG